MGEQIRLIDLARDLIRPAGFVPGEEIPIVFTGLRPGEKVFEELVGEDEEVEASLIKEIRAARGRRPMPRPELAAAIQSLEALAERGDEQAIVAALGAIVPEFTPGAQWTSAGFQENRLAG